MVDEHKHEHEQEPQEPPQPPSQAEELDAAGRSLSDALRISFAILKVIMIILVVAFLASGFKTVGPDEKALVLRFGKVRGIGQEAILGPGAHWVFPYPIDELVRIPVEKNINLAINTFWYRETRDDILGPGVKPRNYRAEQLDPEKEGYCLTGSQRNAARAAVAGTVPPIAVAALPPIPLGDGSDYNIVHTKWQVNYQITGVEQFFRNVYVQEVKPGAIYFDVMTESITPLLRSLVEDAVVKEMVQYTIDEALQSTDKIPRGVQRLVQQKLDAIGSGISVVQVQLVNVSWPMQVDQAFKDFVKASQTSQQKVTEARTYADTTLTKVAGPMAEALYRVLRDQNVSESQRAALWAQVTGHVQDVVAQAQTYQTKVVEKARANADYMRQILPGYRQQPELVAHQIYVDAMQEVLKNVEEKIVFDRCDQVKEREIRVLINRDALLKPRQSQPGPATK